MTRLVFNRDGGKTDEFGHLVGLTRLITGEVIGGLTVAQNASPNMTVVVATGVAAIPTGSGATAYAYYVGTDAAETVTITTANGSNPRKDVIVAYVDKSVAASTSNTNNSNNMLKIVAVAGTPAAVPAEPNSTAIQAAIGASNPYIKLATITVATATTTITTANILDTRTLAQFGTSKIADGSITNAKLSTIAGDVGGSWTPWTPTWTNLVVGTTGSAVSYKYSVIGKTVFCRVLITFGSGASISTSQLVSANLPVAANADYATSIHSVPIGQMRYSDIGAANYSGFVRITANDSTKFELLTYDSGASFVRENLFPSSAASGDLLSATFSYEAA